MFDILAKLSLAMLELKGVVARLISVTCIKSSTAHLLGHAAAVDLRGEVSREKAVALAKAVAGVVAGAVAGMVARMVAVPKKQSHSQESRQRIPPHHVQVRMIRLLQSQNHKEICQRRRHKLQNPIQNHPAT